MQLIIDGGDAPSRRGEVISRYPESSFAYIKPEKTKTVIAVDDIRALITTLSISSPIARVVWVEEAEALSTTSQNTLLKTLEEPPANTHFVLTLPNHRVLLPTILSRCELIHLGPVEQLVDHAQLKIVKSAMQAGLAARLATGASLGKERDVLATWFNTLLHSLHATLETTTNRKSQIILSDIATLAAGALDGLNKNGNVTLVRDHFFLSLPKSK